MAINDAYYSKFWARRMFTSEQEQDYSNVADFISNNSFATCNLDDIDELNNNTQINNELIKTSNEWIQVLKNQFPKAF